LNRDGDDVIDQQRRGRDLRHPWPEIFPRHDVGTAGAGVGHHDLAIRRGHQSKNHQDHADQRQQKHECGHPGSRQQLNHDLLRAIRGRRDRIRRKRPERNGIRQLLMLKVVGDHWLPEESPLPAVVERRRKLLLISQSRHPLFVTDRGDRRRLPYGTLTPAILQAAD
jgi:hypothetical protein